MDNHLYTFVQCHVGNNVFVRTCGLHGNVYALVVTFERQDDDDGSFLSFVSICCCCCWMTTTKPRPTKSGGDHRACIRQRGPARRACRDGTRWAAR
jgi:hypothetical protein